MAKKKFYGNSNVNKLIEIERQKRLLEKINSVMPNVYASVAIALVTEYGWDKQQVADLIAFTGELWKQAYDKGVSMLTWCTDLTGMKIEEMAKDKAKIDPKYQGGCEVYDCTD